MGAKSANVRQGDKERALLEGGGQKSELGRQIASRANKYVNETATKDYSGLYRGRLGADAAQQLSQAVETSNRIQAATGRGRLAGTRTGKAATNARLAALSEGTRRGAISRDQNIFSAADVSMGKQAGSSRNMAQLAAQQSEEAYTQAQLAAQEANNMRGALMGLASAGVGAYQQNKMDKMRMADMKDFELAKKHRIIPEDMSYADFSQNYLHDNGQRGSAWLNRNLSYGNRLANALGGAG